MAQLTVRIPDQLVSELRAAAAGAGRSLNAWITAVLSAAVNPDLAGDEAQALRERLVRAGLLMPVSGRRRPRPPAGDVARARTAAQRGQSLAELVSENRG